MQLVATAIVGLLATKVSSIVFYRMGQKSIKKSLTKQTEKLTEVQAEPISELVDRIDGVIEIFEQSNPDLAQEIHDVIKKGIINPIVDRYLTDGSKCTICKTGELRVERFEPGPLGSCNAIFKCSKCNRLFQTPDCP